MEVIPKMKKVAKQRPMQSRMPMTRYYAMRGGGRTYEHVAALTAALGDTVAEETGDTEAEEQIAETRHGEREEGAYYTIPM